MTNFLKKIGANPMDIQNDSTDDEIQTDTDVEVKDERIFLELERLQQENELLQEEIKHLEQQLSEVAQQAPVITSAVEEEVEETEPDRVQDLLDELAVKENELRRMSEEKELWQERFRRTEELLKERSVTEQGSGENDVDELRRELEVEREKNKMLLDDNERYQTEKGKLEKMLSRLRRRVIILVATIAMTGALALGFLLWALS